MENCKIILQQELDSTEATAAAAQEFTRELKQGDVVALTGELGSGKTFFVREVARSMNCNESVTSPSFVILNIYEAHIPIYHFDLYRLEQEDELENIGFSDFLNRNGIVFVEWPEIAQNILPANYYKVELKILAKNQRKIVIKKINKE